jgi:hypothetical protein
MSRFIALGLAIFFAISGMATQVQADEPQPTSQHRVYVPMLVIPQATVLANAEAEAAFVAFAEARHAHYGCVAPLVRDASLDEVANQLINGPVQGLEIGGFGYFSLSAPFPMPSQLWQGCEGENHRQADGPLTRAGLAKKISDGQVSWLVVLDR